MNASKIVSNIINMQWTDKEYEEYVKTKLPNVVHMKDWDKYAKLHKTIKGIKA